MKLTMDAQNTAQTWTFDAGISPMEQLALWVILRSLCEQQIGKMLGGK